MYDLGKGPGEQGCFHNPEDEDEDEDSLGQNLTFSFIVVDLGGFQGLVSYEASSYEGRGGVH